MTIRRRSTGAMYLSLTEDLKEETMRQQEYIICAANHYDDKIKYVFEPQGIETGFVIAGRRHHNAIHIFSKMVGFPYSKKSLKLKNTETEGFLTNKDRFVSRKEAAEIAFLAGQISERTTHPIGLFSEDLY